jgi:hypothetical protein
MRSAKLPRTDLRFRVTFPTSAGGWRPGTVAAVQRGAIRLERLDPSACDWQAMDAFGDRQVFQTRAWTAFLADAHDAEPVVAAVREGERTVGYFTGLMVRRFGVRILGSPFPGWHTGYLGFNLEPGVSRRDAVEALLPFAWKALGCRHLELRDRQLTLDEVAGLGFAHTPRVTLEVDLSRDEDDLFAALKSSARRNIRKAEREGVVIEEAADLAFADDFHAQLTDVFAKQALPPPYGVERVRKLIRHVHPSGRLLLLRARDADGRCIATLICPALNRSAYFWGSASWRADQHLRPNEALWWYAARHWRRRGITGFDMGGGGDYKQKYGISAELTIPLLRASRSPAVARLRSGAERSVELRRRAIGRLRPGAALPRP